MVYRKLIGRMHEMGFQHNEVAAKMGLSKTQISHRMHGKVPFTIEEVYKIGETLQIPNNELLSYFPRGETTQQLKKNIVHLQKSRVVTQA